MNVICLLLCFIVLCYAGPDTNTVYEPTTKVRSASKRKSVLKWGYECANETKIASDQWELLFTYLLTGKELNDPYKCLLACINKKIGIQHKISGEFNSAGFIAALEKIKHFYHNGQFISDKKKSIRCLNKLPAGENECDTAGKLIKCVDLAQIKAFEGARRAGFINIAFRNAPNKPLNVKGRWNIKYLS